jgi:hypothetical protein
MNKDLFKFISKDEQENCKLILEAVEKLRDMRIASNVMGRHGSGSIYSDLHYAEDIEAIKKLDQIIETIKEII